MWPLLAAFPIFVVHCVAFFAAILADAVSVLANHLNFL